MLAPLCLLGVLLKVFLKYDLNVGRQRALVGLCQGLNALLQFGRDAKGDRGGLRHVHTLYEIVVDRREFAL